MKILLLNQTFYPDNAATAQYLTDLAVELARKGFCVDVVSDRCSYDERSKILPKKEIYKGVRICRIRSTILGKKTKFHRGIDYLSFTVSLLFRMFGLPRYDIVIGLTTPPWISFFGILFCKFKGGRFIHWAMDINPDEAVRLGWVKQGSLFCKVLNAWARFTYQKSHKIIALDKYMAELIESKGIDDNKIHVIPAWSPDEIDSVNHNDNPFRKKYSLDSKFVVMYSGNFSICHPIDTMLEAAKELKGDPSIVFMFIGGGVRLSEILEFKEKYGLENIIYLPYQKREDIKYSLSAADLHVISLGNDYVGIVHPSKIYGVLSTGRPFVLIGPKKSHIGDIINGNQIGYQIEHGDVRGLLRVIEKAKSLSDEQKNEIKHKAISLSKNRYSSQHLLNYFINKILNATIS